MGKEGAGRVTNWWGEVPNYLLWLAKHHKLFMMQCSEHSDMIWHQFCLPLCMHTHTTASLFPFPLQILQQGHVLRDLQTQSLLGAPSPPPVSRLPPSPLAHFCSRWRTVLGAPGLRNLRPICACMGVCEYWGFFSTYMQVTQAGLSNWFCLSVNRF